MADLLAEAHRRIAAAERGVEQSLKRLAWTVTEQNPVAADAERTRARMLRDAEKLAERADEHSRAADRIDDRAGD